jgi:hypothetical protein
MRRNKKRAYRVETIQRYTAADGTPVTEHVYRTGERISYHINNTGDKIYHNGTKKEIQNFEKRQKHEKGAEAALTTILKATYYLWVPVFAYFMTPSTASNNEYIKYLERVGETVEDDDRKTYKVRYRETLKEMIQKKSAA